MKSLFFCLLFGSLFNVFPEADATVLQNDTEAQEYVLSIIEGNYSLWLNQDITDYSFTFSWTCFCEYCYTSAKNIQVYNSSNILSVSYVNSDENCDNTGIIKEYYFSINDLFNKLIDRVKGNNNNNNNESDTYSLSVTFNSEYHYPESAWIDPYLMMADEEYGWTISSLSIGLPGLMDTTAVTQDSSDSSSEDDDDDDGFGEIFESENVEYTIVGVIVGIICCGLCISIILRRKRNKNGYKMKVENDDFDDYHDYHEQHTPNTNTNNNNVSVNVAGETQTAMTIQSNEQPAV